MSKKNKAKYKVSEIPHNIFSKFCVRFIGAGALLIAGIIIGIVTKNIMYFYMLALFSVVCVFTSLYSIYLFCHDKVMYCEGPIVKIVNKTKSKRKYKDIYIKTEDDNYFRLEMAKSKEEYQLGVNLRIFVLPENVFNKGASNSFLIRNPLMIEMLEAEYVEGEETVKNKKGTEEL